MKASAIRQYPCLVFAHSPALGFLTLILMRLVSLVLIRFYLLQKTKLISMLFQSSILAEELEYLPV
jgi:uncharacterized protein involved in cysteine biosynthesis